MKRQSRPPMLPTLMVLAGLLGAGGTALANDGHGESAPKAKAKPDAKAEPTPAAKPGPAQVEASDSMDALRQRLAERLGAVKSPDSKSPYVLRVANKSNDSAQAEPARRAPRPAADSHGAAAESPVAAGLLPGKHDSHWDYVGENGPEAWGRMKPDFATCSTGQRQSPIDIRDGIPVQLQPIEFDYHPTGFNVIDNGHTVQVNLSPGNAISVGGRRYDLLQFHFHRPSEERINGRQFDMVAHLVHKDPEGRLAVVAVLLDRGSAQPVIQTVWNALPLEKGEAAPAAVPIDLNQLLPEDRRYYTYMGSLTTPPCSEGVLWMVMKQPVQLSPQQIGIFARLYPMNARPIQKVAGRLIKESN